jgi:dethiobiotin synthetase
MNRGFIVSGTDTGIGKTTVAAMLVLALDALYWKPIQSGTQDGTDTQRVRALTLLPDDRFLPERYVLLQPLSPHRAAELDGVAIEPEALMVPAAARTLIVEGAGGLMVPITRRFLQIDLFADWGLPIEALRSRRLQLHGLIFVGNDNADNVRTIVEFSGARVLGHVPQLQSIDRGALLDAFVRGFRREDF